MAPNKNKSLEKTIMCFMKTIMYINEKSLVKIVFSIFLRITQYF